MACTLLQIDKALPGWQLTFIGSRFSSHQHVHSGCCGLCTSSEPVLTNHASRALDGSSKRVLASPMTTQREGSSVRCPATSCWHPSRMMEKPALPMMQENTMMPRGSMRVCPHITSSVLTEAVLPTRTQGVHPPRVDVVPKGRRQGAVSNKWFTAVDCHQNANASMDREACMHACTGSLPGHSADTEFTRMTGMFAHCTHISSMPTDTCSFSSNDD